MKVGILTFQAANNYGAFLQCYALYKKLNEYSVVDAEIIDYICPAIEDDYKPVSILKKSGNPIKKRITYYARKPVMRQMQRKFQTERNNLLNMNFNRLSRIEMQSIEHEFDTFIVGSDQVWNTKLTQDDRTYFLDFVKTVNKKNSYAASIGNFDFDEIRKKQLKNDLNEFNKLSVREKSAAYTISELTGRNDVVTCIDPVFLYNKNKWEKDMTLPKETDYVLFFSVGNPTEETFTYAKNYAKKNGKKLLLLCDKDIPYKHLLVKHLYGVGPMEFLGYIHNAFCVITNSFHATAFSIIFHTPFYVETSVKRNERITNLLDITQLRSRGLLKGRLTSSNEKIEWGKVDDNLAPFICKSVAYLEEMIIN